MESAGAANPAVVNNDIFLRNRFLRLGNNVMPNISKDSEQEDGLVGYLPARLS